MPENPDFNAWFPEPDGLPRPDWKSIRQWIRSHSSEEHWDAGWQEIVRFWLHKLAERLGGNYKTAESANFHLLSELDEQHGQGLLSFLEKTRESMLRTLCDIRLPKRYGKHVVLRFTTDDQYYRYVAHFDPEGDYAGSGGRFLHGGYMHIAFPHADHPNADRSTLVHEFTHNLLQSLKLPRWLDEALAMLFESDIAGHRQPPLTRDLAAEHRAYWNKDTIQEFWNGSAFWKTKSQSLSYSLARILVDFIVTDIQPAPPDFRDFVLHAECRDAGEAAARNFLGVELSDLVSAFLGPGEWSPRLQGATSDSPTIGRRAT